MVMEISPIYYEGTGVWHIQLMQTGLTIENGITYEYSFTASADAERTIEAKIGGGADVGYASYSNFTGEAGEQFTITTTPTTYSSSFTMTEATNTNANFEFLLGNAGTDGVYIDDVVLLATGEAAPTVELSEEMIINGTFDADITGWTTYQNNGATATIANDGAGAMLISSIANTATETWDIQATQGDLNIVYGGTYIYSFDAKAAAARTMWVKLGDTGTRGSLDYSQSGGTPQTGKAYSLTTEYQTFTYVFAMDYGDDPAARIEFQFGLDTNDVWIDNVTLKQITNATGDLMNGSFDQTIDGAIAIDGVADTSFWQMLYNDGLASTAATVTNDTGEFHLGSITDAGANSWSLQLLQAPLTLEMGATYNYSFDAKASGARTITAKIGATVGRGYVPYSEQTVDLTTEYQTFSGTFTMDPAVATNYFSRFEFLLGAVSTEDVWIDNVTLTKQ
jgi:hypothetical protein